MLLLFLLLLLLTVICCFLSRTAVWVATCNTLKNSYACMFLHVLFSLVLALPAPADLLCGGGRGQARGPPIELAHGHPPGQDLLAQVEGEHGTKHGVCRGPLDVRCFLFSSRSARLSTTTPRIHSPRYKSYVSYVPVFLHIANCNARVQFAI